MIQYIFAFLVGGIITTAIIFFESAGFPLLSRLAALFPIFTWLSYLFIGSLKGAKEVASHSMFVLLGTVFCWIPYMLLIYFLAPKLGTNYSVLIAIAAFIILAIIFISVYNRVL